MYKFSWKTCENIDLEERELESSIKICGIRLSSFRVIRVYRLYIVAITSIILIVVGSRNYS